MWIKNEDGQGHTWVKDNFKSPKHCQTCNKLMIPEDYTQRGSLELKKFCSVECMKKGRIVINFGNK